MKNSEMPRRGGIHPDGARAQFYGIGESGHAQLRGIVMAARSEIIEPARRLEMTPVVQSAMKAASRMTWILGLPPIHFEVVCPLDDRIWLEPLAWVYREEFDVRISASGLRQAGWISFLLENIWETPFYWLVHHHDDSLANFLLQDVLSRCSILSDFIQETQRVCGVESLLRMEYPSDDSSR